MSLEAEATPEQLVFQAEVETALGFSSSEITELTNERMVLRFTTARVEVLRVICHLTDEVWQVHDFLALTQKAFWCAMGYRGLRATE